MGRRSIKRIKEEARTALVELGSAFPQLASVKEQHERVDSELFLRWVDELPSQKPDIESYPPAVIDAYLALSECLNPSSYHISVSEFKLPMGLTSVYLTAQHLTTPDLSAPVRVTIIYNEKGELASRREIVDAWYHGARHTLSSMQDTGIEMEVLNMFADSVDKAQFLERFRRTDFAQGLEETVREKQMPHDIHEFMPMYNTPEFRSNPRSIVFRQPKTAEDKRYRKPEQYRLIDKLNRPFD